MKITVTTERDCCHPAEDLIPYQGIGVAPVLKPKFCKHCGQLWILDSFTDAAGSRDTERIRHIPNLGTTSQQPR